MGMILQSILESERWFHMYLKIAKFEDKCYHLRMELVLQHFKAIPSTNRYAKEHILSFERDKLYWITASTQTAGRGQYGRRWVSSPEDITGSFVFFVEENQENALSLTHVLAIAVVEILEVLHVKGRIKWPNDVMIENKKIAGILCETLKVESFFGVVMGVGLNVNMPFDELATVGQPATSLYVETGKKVAVNEVSALLSQTFQRYLTQFLKEGFTPFSLRFRSLILPRKKG